MSANSNLNSSDAALLASYELGKYPPKPAWPPPLFQQIIPPHELREEKQQPGDRIQGISAWKDPPGCENIQHITVQVMISWHLSHAMSLSMLGLCTHLPSSAFLPDLPSLFLWQVKSLWHHSIPREGWPIALWQWQMPTAGSLIYRRLQE